jgi:hypothetical protein
VQELRASGEAYCDILFTCEQYLLSVNRDEELEKELERIQTIMKAVQINQSHLKKF